MGREGEMSTALSLYSLRRHLWLMGRVVEKGFLILRGEIGSIVTT